MKLFISDDSCSNLTVDDVDWSDEVWNEIYQSHYWQSLCFYLEEYKKDDLKEGTVNELFNGW